MQNPDDRAAETRWRETGLVESNMLGRNPLEPIDDPAPYVKEPLFNKKVMAAWALGALALWFAVSMIVPIARDAARTSIREAVQEVETGTDGTITIRRNGKVISITRGPNPTVRVNTEGTAPPVPAVPPAAPQAAAPPTEAPPAKR